MTIHDLLQAIGNDGVTIKISETGGLTYSGERAAAERWLPLLRERRNEIIVYLSSCQPTQLPPLDLESLYEQFTERAAIAEYDGGLSREDAERMALDYILKIACQHCGKWGVHEN